jgi:hypothetical protein
MENAIPIALEARAKRIGLFGLLAVACTKRPRCMWREELRFMCFARIAGHQLQAPGSGP